MVEKQTRFENLVNAYSNWLYRYAYWLCGEKSSAEDLVQETFLRAWRFMDSLKEESSAKAWLTTILRRENARKYEKKSFSYSEVELDEIPAQQNDFDDRPEVIALHIALRELPEKYREPLVLQVLEGYSLDEIATMFKLPRNRYSDKIRR